MDEKIKDKIEMIRTQIRAAAFLIPLVSLCIALFVLPDVRKLVVAYTIGAANVAAIFYFKKSEDDG